MQRSTKMTSVDLTNGASDSANRGKQHPRSFFFCPYDHLAQVTEWTYVGSKSGSSQTDSISLPSQFNELHIVSTVGTGMSHTNSRFVYNILYDELSDGETYYYENGFGWDGKSYRVWIEVSKTSVKGGYANFGNAVKTHEVKVWYR